MSQTSVTSRVGATEEDSRVPFGLKVAKYTINAGKTSQRTVGSVAATAGFLSDTTVILDGPPLLPGDIILNVVTDCIEVFGDSDGGDNTTLNIRFNDGATQTDIVAAASIGGAPYSSVSRVLSVQDFATAGHWLKLTLTTRVEVVVEDAVDLDDGIMDIYVMYVSPRG